MDDKFGDEKIEEIIKLKVELSEIQELIRETEDKSIIIDNDSRKGLKKLR